MTFVARTRGVYLRCGDNHVSINSRLIIDNRQRSRIYLVQGPTCPNLHPSMSTLSTSSEPLRAAKSKLSSLLFEYFLNGSLLSIQCRLLSDSISHYNGLVTCSSSPSIDLALILMVYSTKCVISSARVELSRLFDFSRLRLLLFPLCNL